MSAGIMRDALIVVELSKSKRDERHLACHGRVGREQRSFWQSVAVKTKDVDTRRRGYRSTARTDCPREVSGDVRLGRPRLQEASK